MEQIDMFSLLSGGERKELYLYDLARMPGRKVELVFRTSARAWSQTVKVERVVENFGHRTLVYSYEGGYGFLEEEAFSLSSRYPVKAYEVT